MQVGSRPKLKGFRGADLRISVACAMATVAACVQGDDGTLRRVHS